MRDSCFHYTNLDSLFHIIQNETIHLSSLSMMNVPQETKGDDELITEIYLDKFSVNSHDFLLRKSTSEIQFEYYLHIPA